VIDEKGFPENASMKSPEGWFSLLETSPVFASQIEDHPPWKQRFSSFVKRKVCCSSFLEGRGK
jgi:hypothetical protein